MNKMRLRLVLDSIAASLLLVGLAYYWLGEVAHELIGTGMFLLIVMHNVFNRRWYGTLSKGRREARTIINVAITLCLMTAMLVLLITSLMISRVLFDFLPLNGGAMARRIHALSAYWALVIVSTHLGLRWPMIMNVVRSTFMFNTGNPARAAMLRAIAAAIAAYGVYSSFAMGIGSKLTLQVTMDWWDFGDSTLGFFLHHLSIIGLYIFLIHYTIKWGEGRKRAAASVWPVLRPRVREE